MQGERMLPKNRVVVATLIALIIAIFPAASFAHPMGNFSINHYSGIAIQGDSVDVLYLIDMAEIPTFREM
jgi:hypothetical protein